MPENDKYLIPYLRSCFEIKSDLIALKNFGTTHISYHELYDYCFKQNPFGNSNLDKTNLIAIFGDKSPEYVKNIYAVIASGNAYLPLDFYSPPQRLCYVLQNAGVKFLLLQKLNSEALLAYFKENNIYIVADNFDETYLKISFNSFKFYPSNTAYVLYTSGSTGSPKGVIHTHNSALAFINWFNESLGIKQGSVFLSVSPFSFDVSISDVFCSIKKQGTLVIPQFGEASNFRLLAANIQKFEINCLYSTPSFFNALIQFGKLEQYNFTNVACVLFAGEQLYANLVLKMKDVFKNASMFNLYGPTETNVVSYYSIHPNNIQAESAIPIGKMCSYSESYLLPVDGDYELCVNSESTMWGYVNNGDSFVTIEGKQFYNTGDLVTLNENKDLVFKGRRDKMIKRNGFRIEIGEIERTLQVCEWITDFAIKTEYNEEVKIKVFYVGDESVSELELKNYFLKKLPSYMLPDNFIKVEAISKNTNFKVDLSNL